jgi:hypothetical protein
VFAASAGTLRVLDVATAEPAVASAGLAVAAASS